MHRQSGNIICSSKTNLNSELLTLSNFIIVPRVFICLSEDNLLSFSRFSHSLISKRKKNINVLCYLHISLKWFLDSHRMKMLHVTTCMLIFKILKKKNYNKYMEEIFVWKRARIISVIEQKTFLLRLVTKIVL